MRTLNLIEYLRHGASAYPDKTAYELSGEQLTYSEMDRLAQSAGTALANLIPDTVRPIAVMTERTPSCIALLQGVLYAGCYYAPLDADTPPARLEKILEKLSPAVIVTCGRALPGGLNIGCPVVGAECLFSTSPDLKLLEKRISEVCDSDPAYVIFTSGSTGDPKGIAVPHRGVIDFTEWLISACNLTHEDVFGSQCPLFFDASVKEMYSSLALGATVHIIPKKSFMFPKLVVNELTSGKVTAIAWATSAFHLIASSGILEKEKPEYLKKIIVGGEQLVAKHYNAWKKALPDAEYYNLYGPTEVTVDCSYYKIDREFSDTDVIPIGNACKNKRIYLLDRELNEVGNGQPGEICVTGSGIACGYYNDPEKTASSFIQNPLKGAYPEIMYRTGDLAYRNERGELVFLERADGQIKHNGYRIELGEIERALNSIGGVDSAVCLYDKSREKIICVYQSHTALSSDALVKELRGMLPKYMLPNRCVSVEEMPYNPNGKLDRRLLGEMYANGTDRS